jgi:hypothetical protein
MIKKWRWLWFIIHKIIWSWCRTSSPNYRGYF